MRPAGPTLTAGAVGPAGDGRQLPRLEASASPIHGTGVFAREPIAAGAHVGVFEGSPVDSDGTHVLWVTGDDGAWHGIEGTSVLRWLNHSSEPNSEFDGIDLYALCDIAAGEELLIDYGPDWRS